MKYNFYIVCYQNEKSKKEGLISLNSPYLGEEREQQKDISECDWNTIDYTKKEFFEKNKLNLDWKNTDIYIAYIHSSKKIRIFNPLFKPSKDPYFYESILYDLKKTIQERMDNVYKSATQKLFSKDFERLSYKILKSILSNDAYRLKLTSVSSKIYPAILKDYLQRCDTIPVLNSAFPYILNYLRDYKTLRILLLEYMNCHDQEAIYSTKTRLKFINSHFFEPYISDNLTKSTQEGYSLEIHYLIDKIMKGGIENSKLAYYFEYGGLEYILENMDGNDKYESSQEDLLRCGIFSKEEYLKLKGIK